MADGLRAVRNFDKELSAQFEVPATHGRARSRHRGSGRRGGHRFLGPVGELGRAEVRAGGDRGPRRYSDPLLQIGGTCQPAGDRDRGRDRAGVEAPYPQCRTLPPAG